MAEDGHHPMAVEMEEEYHKKVTFFVGGTEAAESSSSTPSSPLSYNPQASVTSPLDDNVFEDSGPILGHSSPTAEVRVRTESTKSTYSYKMQSEQKQTTITALPGTVSTTTIVTSQGKADKEKVVQTAEMITTGDKTLVESDKMLEKTSSVSSSLTATQQSSLVPATRSIDRKASSSNEPQKAIASPGSIMQTFEEQEKLFREMFLSQSIMDLSQETEKSLSLPSSRKVSCSDSSSSPSRPHVIGLDHLDNLVKMLEQLAWLKEENSQLKKKVLYLEDTKSLLLVKAQMVETKHQQQIDSLEHNHQSPGGFFHHQHSRAKSIISKQSSKIMQYLSTSTEKTQQAPVSKMPLEKCPSDSSDVIGRISKLQPQSSDQEPTTPTTPVPTSEPSPASSAAQKFHSRSQSVGSIEMVDLNLTTTVMELDTFKPSARRSSPSKSLMFKRSDFKASRKLQEKWERVKKAFGSKPESGKGDFDGSITAEEILKANSSRSRTRSSTLRSNRPPSLTHMCSLDTNSVVMDSLKPEDRVISRSNPQLNEQPPHTPSSTHSEPPAGHTGATSEEEDTAFKFHNVGDAPAPSTHKPQQGQPVPQRAQTSSTSSTDSDEGSAEVEEAFKNTPKLAKQRRLEDDDNFLSPDVILKRRRSSPTLSTQDQDTEKDSAGQKSPRIGRSASFKVMRQKSPSCQLETGESVSVPSTPVSSEDQRKHSPFRAAISTDAAHKKAKLAWGRVKTIIHNRKDSLKIKKSKSAEERDSDVDPSFLSSGEEEQNISPAPTHVSATTTTTTPALTAATRTSDSTTTSSTKPDSSTTTSTTTETAAPTKQSSSSPTLLRRLTQKARGASPRRLSPDTRGGGGKSTLSKPSSPDRASSPGGSIPVDAKQKRESIAQAMASGSPADVMALMGVSEEYQKKMLDWEDKKKRGLTKANSFAFEGDAGPEQQISQQQQQQQQPKQQQGPTKKEKENVKYSEEFIKKKKVPTATLR